MSDAEEDFHSRSRRSSSEVQFLAQSIDTMMESYLKNQDAVLKHQTEMVEGLIRSQNGTEQIDSHFFDMMHEIRRGYFKLMENLEKRVIDPMCPKVTPFLYFISIGLLVSLVSNLIMVYLLCRSRKTL